MSGSVQATSALGDSDAALRDSDAALRDSDAAQRARALDVSTSFLVQAPAGSGKTALLTQRLLCLLATVREPEEILAITFTRKAAAEMRGRLLETLRAASLPRPDDAFQASTWDLAQRVLERDQQCGWQLLDSPGRLRVQTIDAFQQSLVQRMPWMSKAGVSISPTDSAQPLYADAVRDALRHLASNADESGEDTRALVDLLLYRDNHLAQLSTFLVELLEKRDQWLRILSDFVLRDTNPEDLRAMLEGNLRRELELRLRAMRAALPEGLDATLAPFARYAAENLAATNHPIEALAAFRGWPEATEGALPVWRGLAALLLTNDGDIRKSLDTRIGFPGGEKQWKPAMADWLKTLAGHPSADATAAALREAAKLPASRYSDVQWNTLLALFRLMRVLAPTLHLQFAEKGQTDFAEIALRAVSALEEAPGASSVLAERLDARLRHILVDEFQDTSILQMQLIRALTSNWSPGDGNTLFLVGDPMQSIYGWRNARVDLFLRAWQGAVPGLPRLETLRLSRNFRSRARLIAECNAIFTAVLPAENNAALGRVALSPAIAGSDQQDTLDTRIQCQGFLAPERNPRAEALWLASEVARLRAAQPDARIGVLFRKKSLGATVGAALAEQGIAYQAVDLENLADLPVVMDLRSLLNALLSPANRLAWWSLLRAPWNGLRLSTLQHLASLGAGRTVWHAVQRACALGSDAIGDPDELLRLRRTEQVFAEAFRWRGRRPLHQVLRAVFVSLGAAAAHADARSQVAAAEFFRLLRQQDEATLLSDPATLDDPLSRLQAPADPKAPSSLQLLTIHKAKGLEFDIVFVPYLNGKVGHASERVLEWDEGTPGTDEAEGPLLLAPGKGVDDEGPSHASFLKQRRVAREIQEGKRVLYVALTRARQQVFLSATLDPLKIKGPDSLRPMPGSYLVEAPLWQRFQPLFLQLWQQFQGQAPAPVGAPDGSPLSYPLLRRLNAAALPKLDAQPEVAAALGDVGVAMLYRPGGAWETVETAQGTVFHRVMEMISSSAALRRAAGADVASQGALSEMVSDTLRRLLPTEANLDAATNLVLAGLRKMAASPTGALVFADTHQRVYREQALSYTDGNALREVRLDRVFQDRDGLWHIVDFKLVSEDPQDLDSFLAAQRARYQQGMQHYGRLWQREFPGPVVLLLYFPLQDQAIRWTLQPASLTA
ncbi:MAG: UvrD-helicase domain-containing protein [Bryobacterales bacterium]|jgi:ATP-dependent exoDNAse (exonuclease V) beta subunit|nr:UvrD-helicase domain-containing protein [Bryobacterales bacterium]